MTSPIRISARLVRKSAPVRTLTDRAQLQAGDHVHMLAPGARMVLIFEDRGGYPVLRCHQLHLSSHVPRGRGLGTVFHRAVEDRVRDLGLTFCTADDATVDGNAVTTAMRERLVKLYPYAERVGDAWVLLGPRARDSAQDRLRSLRGEQKGDSDGRPAEE